MVQGVAIPSVGITVKPGRIPGAEITAEAQRSAEELAGLRPGDVINAVDGKAVNTPMELAAELSARAVGDKVRLGFMIHGQWQSEAVVQLQSH